MRAGSSIHFYLPTSNFIKLLTSICPGRPFGHRRTFRGKARRGGRDWRPGSLRPRFPAAVQPPPIQNVLRFRPDSPRSERHSELRPERVSPSLHRDETGRPREEGQVSPGQRRPYRSKPGSGAQSGLFFLTSVRGRFPGRSPRVLSQFTDQVSMARARLFSIARISVTSKLTFSDRPNFDVLLPLQEAVKQAGQRLGVHRRSQEVRLPVAPD